MYCQSTNICLGELHLSSAGFGLSSVDPALEQVSNSRRATSFVAKCFQMYCQSTLDLSGEVTFCVLYCHESLNVLVKYLQSAWRDTPILLPDASNVLSEYHQSAWGSYTCLLCQ